LTITGLITRGIENKGIFKGISFSKQIICLAKYKKIQETRKTQTQKYQSQ